MRRSPTGRVVQAAVAVLFATGLTSACADGANSPQNVTSSSTSAATSGSGKITCTTPPAAKAKDQALSLPDKKSAEGKTFIAALQTNCGTITLELEGAKAPQTVASFEQLAKSYYDDSPCHRLVPDFVLQCGDPTGTGQGGPGYTFGLENTPADNEYPRGTVAMARQRNNANSNGGQFFIMLKTEPIQADSAGGYSIFGKVVGGMDIVDYVAAQGAAAPDANNNTAPNQPISILKITVTEKKA